MTLFGIVIVPFPIVLSVALLAMKIGGDSKENSSLTFVDNNKSIQVEITTPGHGNENRGYSLFEVVHESEPLGQEIRDRLFLVYIRPGDSHNRESTDFLAKLPNKIGQEAKKAELNGLLKIEKERVVFSGANGEVQIINITIPPVSRYALAVN